MKKTLLAWIDKGALAAGHVSALFMVSIVVLINVEIILRALFNTSTLIADEYSGYFLVAVVLMGLAYAVKHDAHIRVEVIRTRLGQKGKNRVDAGCTLLGIVITIYAIYHAVLMAKDAYLLEMTADSISETPLFLPQLMIPLGLILFVLQLIATFIRRLR
jgi:TRAP-type C4-dicarboxylate transport system permease small subunit